MIAFWVRAALSGLIVAAVAAVARRFPTAAALIVSLPLVSVLGMIWLWRDRPDPDNMAIHAEATFWYVLPSLPMFLLIPALLRRGIGFWPALAAGCVLTILAYLAVAATVRRFGIQF